MSQRLSLLVAGDPNQRTGGYLYDARIVSALRTQGWAIEVIGLDGAFPDADATATRALADALAAQPDGATVVIDGLAMGALPDVVTRHVDRLAITALVHHPLGDESGLGADDQQRLHQSELRALAAVSRIIVTSHFTARRLSVLADTLFGGSLSGGIGPCSAGLTGFFQLIGPILLTLVTATLSVGPILLVVALLTEAVHRYRIGTGKS